MEESSTPVFQVLDEFTTSSVFVLIHLTRQPVSLDGQANLALSLKVALIQMLSLGKISQTMFTKLKDGFKHLHDTLKSAHSSEMHVLEEAQRCRAELERIQVKVQSLEEQQSPSEEPDGEVSKLRRQLLQAYNELKAAEERGHTAQHDLQCLWEEKQYLEKEIQTQPADMESNTNLLKGKLDVLKNEVAQRPQDVRKLIEDLETLETLLLKEQKELEENKMIIKIKEAEKAQLACIPNQIMRDIERKRSVWKVAMKRMESLNMELSETKHQMRSVSEGNQSLEMRRQEAMQELEQLRAQIEACQKENRRLLKEQEISREEFAEIMGSSGILEMKLLNLMIDRKQICNSQSVQLRKKHRQVEALRRMEQAVAMATEQLEFTQSTYKQIQVQLLDAVPEREASARQRRELEREMDALKASFEKQVGMCSYNSNSLKQFYLYPGFLHSLEEFGISFKYFFYLTSIEKHHFLWSSSLLSLHPPIIITFLFLMSFPRLHLK
ncbi:myosin-1-like [Cyprinodon tularosa]|uniref:myosin-1-like n=1 Tax=Cyprinodon tularosa TaxID=77115 RepID=UPI0018E280BE|nr:myosin-1-like [Cyprinodon tularosa]